MTKIQNKTEFLKVFNTLNEAQRRHFAALRAIEIGWGGITKVSTLTGLSYKTIKKGIDELNEQELIEDYGCVRKKGGGRKKIEEKDPTIIDDLKQIMEDNTAGDPMSSLKWTNKSTYNIAEELEGMGHEVSPDTVARLLKEQNYSLQANVKSIEPGSSSGRDKQFHYINDQIKKHIELKDPVISVDAKKRENVGKFKNDGKTWRKKNNPKKVNVYDFRSLGIGIALPYGTYDIQRNEGFVNVGISHETSKFAVESIRRWWNVLGKYYYINPNALLITADGGGSNGSNRKGWKFYIQEFANEINIPITICHLPPGTSKWNKIEHRMFSFISINWKGKPLVDYQTVINLISNTTTKEGLIILAKLDQQQYKTGEEFTVEEMNQINIKKHELHPKWNYTIAPK